MDRRSRRAFLAAAPLLAGLSAFAAVTGPDLGLLQEQNRIKTESQEKIDREILDPILGKDMAKSFVDVEMEVKVENEESNRSGMGLAEKYKEKQGMQQHGGMQTTYVLPGIPKPKTITNNNPDKPESATAQQAQQVKGIQEVRYAVNPVFKRLGVAVIHDETVLKDKPTVDLVRTRIVDAMAQYQLQPDQVVFRPTKFNHFKADWREDLKKPEVYLPLLYALLFLLLLSYLFGPLWKFFRDYVKAIKERPNALVNVESKIEQPDDTGEDEGDNEVIQKGQLDLTWQKKPDEPPPPPPLPLPPPEEDDEEDEMKKFEPFSYINEENVKRLAHLFVLRNEEPWVPAVVVSYLRPDLARILLTALPVEYQAKVAIEALTVRQTTREQVMAIDADVRENVDFVIGGLERLTMMLDEADSGTRSNILNYLKNEKPLIYEAVRRNLLVFEDVITFPDREMQVIVRELKTEGMAKALQGASPEVVNKFLSNMSGGAQSLLKEQMEYTTGLNQAQIDEERSKIMDLIKVLEKEGKISVRQKGAEGSDLVEGMQEELGAMERRQKRFAEQRKRTESILKAKEEPPAAEPPPKQATQIELNQAQQYYEAATGYYNAGDAASSVPYFEAALNLNPGLWQAHQFLGGILYQLGRTPEALEHYEMVLRYNPDPQIKAWVDGFKAQVGGQ